MSQNENLLKKIISKHVASTVTIESSEEEQMRLLLEQKLFEQIRQEIIAEEIATIKMMAEHAEKDRQMRARISKAKALLLELVAFAFFIGVIVNQWSEYLSFAKGQTTPDNFNGLWTAVMAVVHFLIMCGLLFLIYFNKIEEWLLEREKS